MQHPNPQSDPRDSRDSSDSIDDLRAAWAATRPDLDTSPAATIGRILRSSRHLTILSDEKLEKFGMSRGEFDVLSALRRSATALTPTDLARQLVTSNASITKRMVQLEKLGFAVRSRGGADRRVVQVSLTDAGRASIDEALPAQLDFERSVEAVLVPADRAELQRILRILLGELESRA
ncbi:MAG: DNA-binding protein [Glaciihabitans sp.]|nr:DNA-binding protein [Glaciihabitans sp.]